MSGAGELSRWVAISCEAWWMGRLAVRLARRRRRRVRMGDILGDVVDTVCTKVDSLRVLLVIMRVVEGTRVFFENQLR